MKKHWDCQRDYQGVETNTDENVSDGFENDASSDAGISSWSRSSNSTTSSRSNSLGPIRSTTDERWCRGCYMKYCLGGCQKQFCSNVHDLNELEIMSFVSWQGQHHSLFGDSSDSGGSRFNSDDEAEGQIGGKREEGSKAHTNLPQQRSQCSSAGPLSEQSGGPWDSGCDTLKAEATDAGKLDRATRSTCRHRVRPGKGKRDRYRRLVARISSQIREDPAAWNADALKDLGVPVSVASHSVLMRKMTARLQRLADSLVLGENVEQGAEQNTPRAGDASSPLTEAGSASQAR